MRLRSRDLFQTAHTEGGLLPAELLAGIADGDLSLGGLGAGDYHLAAGERLGEAVTRSWSRLTGAWAGFDEARQSLPPGEAGGRLTRERWLHVLFDELGYGRLVQQPAVQIQGKAYAVFTEWQHAPIHLVGCGVGIDARTPGVKGAAAQSPHSLVQELLNRSPERLWGFVSNGLVLRVLRDNVALTRQAYLQFDLESMFTGEVYADFVLLWLVCHQSRVEANRPEDCWLERWTRAAGQAGTRALDALRQGVTEAIETLGAGFLAHPANRRLHAALRDGHLDGRDYYQALLRLVYRLLFLFVAEDRDALLDPTADPQARERYLAHYSTRRLRTLASRRRGGRQHDRYEQLKLVMNALDSAGCAPLALPALGSYLWSPHAIDPLAEAALANEHLLDAIRSLSTVEAGGVRRSVDFRNLGAEELGSVYESLLELHPSLDRATATFTLHTAAGSERKETGSYYTPTSLISSLLDTALEPVLDEAARAEDPEAAILSLAVVDPACGSGHFLIAAANRIAKRLAAVRSQDPEPSPAELRAALRDVVGRCVHGVDVNPMAVELCKVSLWMEALEPGRPLSFLDHRIVVGNALLGATPALVAAGIPADAFKPILGDDKKYVTELRKRNAKELSGQLAFDLAGATVDADTHALAQQAAAIDAVDDHSLAGIREQQRRFESLLSSPELRRAALAADLWCTAFVIEKRPGAPPITQDALIRVLSGGTGALRSEELAAVGAARDRYRFLHWHVAFPDVWERGRFDVVLGNPPWDQVQVDPREFFAASAPDIANASDTRKRERLIGSLATEDPALAREYEAEQRRVSGIQHFIHASGRYPTGGSGRLNTAPLFTESALAIVSRTGRAGLVVPTSIATDSSNQALFRQLLESRRLQSLFDFENRERIFPAVDSRARFALLVVCGLEEPVEQPEFMFFAHTVDDLNEADRLLQFSVEQIRRMNPNTLTCPVIRSRRDANILARIYDTFPVIRKRSDGGGGPWGFRQLIMFQSNVDSTILRDELTLAQGHALVGNRFVADTSTFLPLFEAKMIGMWDHRAASIVRSATASVRQGQPAYLDEDAHSDPAAVALPRHWVPQQEVENRLLDKWDRGWLLCIKDITSATNERTTIGAVIPRVGAERSAPVLTVTEPLQVVWLATALFSFVGDYIVRNKIGGTHLTLSYLEQLPVPPPSRFRDHVPYLGCSMATWIHDRVLELVYTATDLSLFARDLGCEAQPFEWDTERRQKIEAELHAAMFRLYGIERDDADYILDTFPIVRRKDEQRFGEYRTKRLILERYDTMVAAEAAGAEYQTPLDPPPGKQRVEVNA